MRFGNFIEDFIESRSERVAYLAQHSLLEQIRQLDKDVRTPDYAFTGTTDRLTRLIWFGPMGTVSPLHTDPCENIYAQICGRKYIRLYAPIYTCNMYAYDTLLSNTSQVCEDILTQKVDENKFPKFIRAQYTDVCVCEGDLLYIPKKWWHFVKSLSVSISISFWFE